MTHYEQCCARECPHCAEGSIREYHSFGDGPLHPVKGGWASCTAPTLDVFAERCAEALAEIKSMCAVLNGVPGGEIQEIARRALGLEK